MITPCNTQFDPLSLQKSPSHEVESTFFLFRQVMHPVTFDRVSIAGVSKTNSTNAFLDLSLKSNIAWDADDKALLMDSNEHWSDFDMSILTVGTPLKFLQTTTVPSGKSRSLLQKAIVCFLETKARDAFQERVT